MKLGKLVTTENKERTFGSPARYHSVLVVMPDGLFETFHLTDSDLKRFRERAARNPEDEIQPGWQDRLLK